MKKPIEQAMPPAMILCGGKGTRLRDVTELLPKPMVPIGEFPIIWHIMRGYAAFGVRRFILCLGYKRENFIDYFVNFKARNCDVTIELGKNEKITYHQDCGESDWEVTLCNTGIETMTGGRVARAARYLQPGDDDFFLTYGDAVSDLDIGALLRFHRQKEKLITLSAVHPEGRFGELVFDHGLVRAFAEKPAHLAGYINGGFMVLKRDFIRRYLDEEESTVLEQAPLSQAVAESQMAAYSHHGYWQCMDTPREHKLLNDLWNENRAPWTKFWSK